MRKLENRRATKDFIQIFVQTLLAGGRVYLVCKLVEEARFAAFVDDFHWFLVVFRVRAGFFIGRRRKNVVILLLLIRILLVL